MSFNMNFASTEQFRKLPARLILIFLITTATVAWLVANPLENWDQRIFEQLMFSFGLSKMMLNANSDQLADQVVASNVTKTVAYVVVSLLTAAAGFFSSYRLRGIPRILSWLQLTVVVVLLQWFLWVSFHFEGRPLAYLLSLVLGITFGVSLRIINHRQHRQEAQYYELLLRNKELEETRLQMVRQDEVERRLLAADLHDQVLNDLKMLKQRIDDYRKLPSKEAATTMEQLLDQAMSEIREVMDSLCPSMLEHLGLAATVEDCLKKGAERAGFKPKFKNSLKADELDVLSMVEMSLLYRLVQESVTNICKHADARTVCGTMAMEDAQLIITIEDDGKGIQPGQLKQDSRGLRYMRQRADLIGATIAWKPGSDGQGTLVKICMDLSEHRAAERLA